tara:strand:- start:5124 stop:6767 length:1644 start_codon:yes stop_codon:yes gene_type:complete
VLFTIIKKIEKIILDRLLIILSNKMSGFEENKMNSTGINFTMDSNWTGVKTDNNFVLLGTIGAYKQHKPMDIIIGRSVEGPCDIVFTDRISYHDFKSRFGYSKDFMYDLNLIDYRGCILTKYSAGRTTNNGSNVSFKATDIFSVHDFNWTKILENYKKDSSRKVIVYMTGLDAMKQIKLKSNLDNFLECQFDKLLDDIEVEVGNRFLIYTDIIFMTDFKDVRFNQFIKNYSEKGRFESDTNGIDTLIEFYSGKTISGEKGNINSFINYDDSIFDYDFSFSKKKEVDSQGRKFDNGFDQTIIVGRTNGRLELTCEESCSYDLVIVFKKKVELKENEIKLSVVDNSGDLFDCGRKLRSSMITIPTVVECNKFIPISYLLKYKEREDELVKVSQGVESFDKFASRRDDFTEIILCNDLDDIVEKVVESEADPIVDMIMELVLSYRHRVSKIITSQLSKKFSSLPTSLEVRRLAKKGEGLNVEYNGVHHPGKVYFPNDHDDFPNFGNIPIVKREGNGNIYGRPVIGGPQISNMSYGAGLDGHQVSLVNTSS